MKRALLFAVMIFALVSQVVAEYPVLWKKLNLINPGSDVTRGLAYNRTTDHVLVASRKSGTDLFILDAATGDSLGKMNTTGISGGTYHINLVTIAEDGAIYVCNLSAPQYSPGSKFKIYRYADETAAPELVFEDALENGRYGDSFIAVGSGDQKYLYASGMDNAKMAVIRDAGGPQLTLDHIINLPVQGNARHGISAVAPLGNVWINAAGPLFPPTLITNDGTIAAICPDTLASAGGTSGITHLQLGLYKFIVVANGYSASVRTVEYTEDELGTVNFAYFGGNSDSLALSYNNVINSNPNATGLITYDSKRNALVTVIGMNSIASLSFNKMLKTSTPRDSNLTVSIDGANDFFPTDHVGASNGRQFYFTWSEGKVFAGITGQTLIDAAQKNVVIWAFDLDPDGTLGSTQPPVAAGGVKNLPFRADVVYVFDSWTEADFMIGKIYKWNGAAWTSTDFDGNLAGQGALAYAAEPFAEFSAIKNDAGIGNAFTKIGTMAYVAQRGADEEVLAAFPGVNAIGKAPAFSAYYYADALGAGMFPTDTRHVQIKVTHPSNVEKIDSGFPQRFYLAQNHPNPYNAVTTIRFDIARPGHVKLEIYDILGKSVATLVDEERPAGAHKIQFESEALSSGVYYYRLSANGESQLRKMVLIK